MRLLVIAFFLFFAGLIEAQTSYFQQRTDYKISVSLDDKKHQLDGKLELKYTNNSPHVLDKIGFHHLLSFASPIVGGEEAKQKISRLTDDSLRQGNYYFLQDGTSTRTGSNPVPEL